MNDINALFEDIGQFSAKYRLVRPKQKLVLKVLEELGEYAVAALGDKVVTETPRQELIDVLITTASLFFMEGGTTKMLGEYGAIKMQKAKAKLENI